MWVGGWMCILVLIFFFFLNYMCWCKCYDVVSLFQECNLFQAVGMVVVYIILSRVMYLYHVPKKAWKMTHSNSKNGEVMLCNQLTETARYY